MPASPEYRAFIADLLAPMGPVKVRRMFGGAGVFLDGLMFGLIKDDELYFKVDDGNRADFEDAGEEPWRYQRKGRKPVALSYYRAPDALYDDPEELQSWARQAFEAALRSRKSKK